MKKGFESEAWYKPERDGSLEDYFETHDGFSTFPLFRGVEIYEKLLKEGYLIPNYSIIRLMWNFGREDEHFLVVENGRLQGIQSPAHAGRKGVMDYKEIIKEEGPCFEAQNLKVKH